MGTLRKLERSIVKSKIKKESKIKREGGSVKHTFENRWKEYRDNKYVTKDEDGNVISDLTPRNTMPKKQRHFDNVQQYNNMFAFFDKLRAESKEEESVESKA